MNPLTDTPREWLETDGLGGYASGTEPGYRTRRYHALLCPATRPPVGRVVLVNGLEVWVETPSASEPLSTQVYASGVVHPDAYKKIESFTVDPWPRWRYRLADGTAVDHELFVPQGTPAIALRWSVENPTQRLLLGVRPLMSGRDFHHTHGDNAFFQFDSDVFNGSVRWQTYQDMPAVFAVHNGRYEQSPQWYWDFLYTADRDRGMEHVEDLGSPGILRFDLSAGEAVLLFFAGEASRPGGSAVDWYRQAAERERSRRMAFPSRLHRAADAYVVKRGRGKSVIAGYPWFSDWGRDTFIALRGLCLATGRLAEAKAILLAWSETVSEGMLPNRFTDEGPTEYNSVDASLWYVVAAGEFLAKPNHDATAEERAKIEAAIEAILDGYAAGTRFGIRLDDDGLIAAGVPGVQLTWMDAKCGDWVVTPRIGKPVEVQALWLNALLMSPNFQAKWSAKFNRGLAALGTKFWNAPGGYLFDVIDVDHRPNVGSGEFRCNQLFAVGGLPRSVLPAEQARKVVDACEERLWTPLGPRTLSPNHPDYCPHYQGDLRSRDGAYHQGTAWPWLAGAFIEAWVRVRGDTPQAKAEARRKFLDPLLSHLDEWGLGHLPEIADAEPPHTPRGCPFQAWSVSEALRLTLDVLTEDDVSSDDLPTGDA